MMHKSTTFILILFFDVDKLEFPIIIIIYENYEKLT